MYFHRLSCDWQRLGEIIAPGIIPDKIFAKDYDSIAQFIQQNYTNSGYVLTFACMYGDLEDIDFLLSSGANKNFNNASSILLTAMHNNINLSTGDSFFMNGVELLKKFRVEIDELSVEQIPLRGYLNEKIAHVKNLMDRRKIIRINSP